MYPRRFEFEFKSPDKDRCIEVFRQHIQEHISPVQEVSHRQWYEGICIFLYVSSQLPFILLTKAYPLTQGKELRSWMGATLTTMLHTNEVHTYQLQHENLFSPKCEEESLSKKKRAAEYFVQHIIDECDERKRNPLALLLAVLSLQLIFHELHAWIWSATKQHKMYIFPRPAIERGKPVAQLIFQELEYHEHPNIVVRSPEYFLNLVQIIAHDPYDTLDAPHA